MFSWAIPYPLKITPPWLIWYTAFHPRAGHTAYPLRRTRVCQQTGGYSLGRDHLPVVSIKEASSGGSRVHILEGFKCFQMGLGLYSQFVILKMQEMLLLDQIALVCEAAVLRNRQHGKGRQRKTKQWIVLTTIVKGYWPRTSTKWNTKVISGSTG